MVTASLTNYRQSPRKVRLVASLIKGKTVDQALNTLMVTTKRASDPMVKLLKSAVANAKDRNISIEGFIIKECSVNQGLTMKRFMPGARGSAFPIHKKTSHVKLVLGPKHSAALAAPKAEKKEAKAEKPVKKAVAKKATK
ncbi:MAG: 50S ribosomal protein L22 [Candidatus Taylorbacteria bacterium]|nr:50S ribosomal protein L22 [Candidatus Taylorbacteria bacterium]